VDCQRGANRLDIQPYAFLPMLFPFKGIGRYSGLALFVPGA
jgi:hypothetical protein